MRIWKIVSGILSIAISLFVVFQSFFAGLLNILTSNGQSSGTAGLVVAIMLLTAGIVSIATHNGSRGGDIAVAVLCGIGTLVGFLGAGSYTDLYIWALWCLLCAAVAMIDFAITSQYQYEDDEEEEEIPEPPPMPKGKRTPVPFQAVILERDPKKRDAVIDALPERQAKNYLKQALNVLVPRQAASQADDSDGLIKILVAALVVLGIFVVGAVCVGIFMSMPKNEQTVSSTPPSESENVQPSESVQPTPTADVNSLTIGDSAALGDWNISVTDFYLTDQIDMSTYTYYHPDAGNQYAVVEATVTNNGTEMDTFLPTIGMGYDVQAEIHYAENYVYSPSVLLGVSEDLHDSSLNPLTSKNGIIAFSVPDAVVNSEDSLSVTFSAGRDEVTFRLR